MDIVQHLRGFGRVLPEYAPIAKFLEDEVGAMQARIKDLEAQLEAVGAGGVQRLESEAAPVAYMYHDTKDAHSVNPMLHSALLVFPCDRRPGYANETPLYTLPRTSIAAGAGGVQAMNKPAPQDAALLAALKEIAALDFGASVFSEDDEWRIEQAAKTVRAYIASKE